MRGEERFAFGKNWRSFLTRLDAERISQARGALTAMLGSTSLAGARCLDIGSGSGLSSLAAVQLGASEVRSIDVDADSVACTRECKRRYAQTADRWRIEQGNVLDRRYLESLGRFDLVYAWGVLHHTGDMYRALENASEAVDLGGRLYISIYNDEGSRSRRWRAIKRTYNRLPRALRPVYVALAMAPSELRAAIGSVVGSRSGDYARSWFDRGRHRGMSRWHDLVDWVGGYPFEVAKPEEICHHLFARGFSLRRLTTCNGSGCNEFVFARDTESCAE